MPTAIVQADRAYRSLDAVLDARIATVCSRHEADTSHIDAARRIIVRRVGLAAGGAVGLAYGSAAMIVALLEWAEPFSTKSALPTELLIGAWPQALFAGAAGSVAARAALRGRFKPRAERTGDAGSDLARLEGVDALRDARAMAKQWELASTALPLAALAMTAPLTIHWAAASIASLGALSARGFADWIAASAVLVGHAHVALLLCAVSWARSLRARETSLVGWGVHGAWSRALGITCAVSAVPGLVFLAVPFVLTAMTGLAFVPLAYVMTARRLVRERLVLEAPPGVASP